MNPPRLLWTALLLAGLVPLLSAAPQMTPAKKIDQGKTAKLEETPAQQEHKRLTALVQKARTDNFKKQAAEIDKARKAGAKMIRPISMVIDLSEFTEMFRAGAKKYAGTDDAIAFLDSVLQVSKGTDKTAHDEVTETLIRDHIKSVVMAEFLAESLGRYSRKLGQENIDRLLKACMKNGSKPVKGAVHYYTGSIALRNRKISAEDKRTAYAQLRLAIKLAPDTSFVKRALGTLYEVDRLQIGMQVPEIEGVDTDGVAFKLSDYKGKVILLDFWGDW